MAYKLIYAPGFLKDMDKIPGKDQKKILDGLVKLKDNYKACDVKKLKGNENYRLRVGSYRVIYDLRPETHEIIVIFVLAVGHRKDVYK